MSLNLDPAPLSLFLERATARVARWFANLPEAARHWLEDAVPRARRALAQDGRVPDWQAALARLPALVVEQREYGDVVQARGSCDDEARASLRAALLALLPWRKGPFELFDVSIDAEWRSDWKWARVLPHLSPLRGRRVLDVGCGNGYYLWRMAQAGARCVLGIDPALAACVQFAALDAYLATPTVAMLPLASADLDARLRCFDTVFSMGVLYHRRDHLAHLHELRKALRADGELLLETLVLVDDDDSLWVPPSRYAGMRNVWALPSPRRVHGWLMEAGFHHIRTVDITPTTVAEQRATAWMPYQSLTDFLDPHDALLTIEGHAAPVRAVFVARAP